MVYLILGASGMAGHMITKYLKSKGHDVITVSRDGKSDITYNVSNHNINGPMIMTKRDKNGKAIGIEQTILGILHQTLPEVVVNCTGMLVNACDYNVQDAILINSIFPHRLHELSQREGLHGFKLVHISTDCVFSGKVGSYNETDITDGQGNYAKTKALGEVGGDSLTIRTSIIGPELKDGTGLLQWFLKQDECQGWVNVYWSGVTTLELAKAIDVLVDKDVKGLYHLTQEKKISKYELLKVISEVYNKDTRIFQVPAIKHCDKSLVDNRNVYTPPSYYDMLKELRDYE